MTAPYQAMVSADGYVVMGANHQKLWRKLCELGPGAAKQAEPGAQGAFSA